MRNRIPNPHVVAPRASVRGALGRAGSRLVDGALFLTALACPPVPPSVPFLMRSRPDPGYLVFLDIQAVIATDTPNRPAKCRRHFCWTRIGGGLSIWGWR